MRSSVTKSGTPRGIFAKTFNGSCALVGSGHSLRCGADWGGTIDSVDAYESVWRVNRYPRHFHKAFWKKCGARTTFGAGTSCSGHSVFKGQTITCLGTWTEVRANALKHLPHFGLGTGH